MYQNSNVESRSFMDPSTGRPNQITEEFVKHCEVSWVPDSVMVTQRRMSRCPILAGLFNCHGTCRAGIAIPGAIELPREKFDNNAAVLEHLFMGHRIPVRVPEPGEWLPTQVCVCLFDDELAQVVLARVGGIQSHKLRLLGNMRVHSLKDRSSRKRRQNQIQWQATSNVGTRDKGSGCPRMLGKSDFAIPTGAARRV